MLNHVRFLFAIVVPTLLVLAAAVDLRAAPQDEEVKPKADLKAGDIKKIQPLFGKVMEDPSSTNIGKLATFLEKWDKKKKFGSPLADVEAWEEIFANHRAKNAPKRVKGAGRITTAEGWFRRQGQIFEYEYAYRIPRNYKPNKPLPTVLCIPNSNSKASTYLKDVWCTGKDNTALADQFILIAATVPKSVKGGKIKGGPYKGRQSTDHTFEWFDYPHVNFLVRPLKAVQKLVNSDPRRVFLEGAGDGAELALHLAALYGVESFAGVAVRNGSAHPDHLNVVDGLGNIAVLLAQRAPHPKEKGDKNRWKKWNSFKKVVEEKKWDRLTIEESTEPAATLDRRTLAGQTVEPFVAANAKIAEFYSTNTAVDFPKEFRIVSDNAFFRSGAGIKILQHEIADGKLLDVQISVDREANAVRMKGDSFSKVSLFLNDRVLDLDRPVEVYVNDVLWERKKVTRSLTEMLKNMRVSPFTGNRLVSAVLVVKEIETDAPASGEGEGDQAAEEGN